MSAARVFVAAAVALALSAPRQAEQERVEPIVSLRYRGGPGGVPVLDDLAAIKAVGFDAITWLDARAADLADVRRLADIVGLVVVVKPVSAPLDPERARSPGSHVDARANDAEARILTPLVWRAVAHGARSITVDPAESRLSRADGSPAAWLAPAVALARQLSANRRLVQALKPGPPLVVAAAESADLDVVLLDGGRAWVIVATNLSPSPVRARVTFPKGVPSGLWASWIDDTEMSMLYQPTGPVWSVEIESYGRRVYFIDKSQLELS